MSAKKPPVTRTKEEHGSKEKLVDRLVGLLAQITKSDESKDDLKGRLLAASNKKLLRLDEIAHAIKEKFGSVEKLAVETAQALGRAKDAPYVDKLKAMTPARLLDLFRASEKRAKKSAKKSKAA
jgi:hypothetical protein